ncbi:flagellar hook-associated protein 2 [Rhodopseudomonas rhenobacensis]|uniref:Flagellar hook-associated protein 2 n=1 Tax=Rhodopseudomonas rhenobacensis TaxID=87461 RepID=A0A7W8E077_9BRAD|nr:flagellar filament capping protein FliD [Rhodopseudomonas rhenobacensis]MBB5049144.1 flagellar hook-associated protein 2 [Rhodopseudomonas rhenobacensis]
MTSVSSTSSSTATTASTSAASTSSSANVTTTGTTNSTSINWDTLIESQVAAKTAQATSIETKITANQTKIAAYEDLQSLLDDIATSAKSLSSSIINSLSGSAFAVRAATISSTGDVSASSALSMSISDAAATGDHTLTISQIATAHSVIGTTVTDKTAELGYDGTFSLGVSGGSSVDIEVSSDMSLEDLVSSINAQTKTTNVQASIIQVSSSSYELVLTASVDNADIVTANVSGDDVMNGLGVTDSSGDFADVLQTARAAIFTLDGVELTRDSNDISDVLTGVTFSLLQTTPSGSSISFDVETDADSIVDAVDALVTAYNSFRDYVYSQQTVTSSGTADEDAVLFGDSTMRDIMSQVAAALNSSIGGLSIADLGLSFDETNNLEFDSSVLEATLSSDLDGVIDLLATTVQTSSSSLSVINTSSSPPGSFTIDLAVDASGNLTSASVGGDSSLFTINGDTIVGASGSIYAGMAFNYRGSTSQSITVTSTSGIAAQIYSLAKDVSNTSTGSLQVLITNLKTQDDTLQQRADTINSAAATYEANLKLRYANYQSAIQSANSMLDYLTALLNSDSDS